MAEIESGEKQHLSGGPPDSWPRRTAVWIHHSRAPAWLIGVASFLESTVVPIPLELILVPLLLWRRRDIWLICSIVTLACLAGASLFYGLGLFFFDQYGEQIVGWFGGDGETSETLQNLMEKHGFWAVLLIAVTPVPFQLGMLLAGASQYSFGMFLLAAGIGRGIRYFGVGFLVERFGDRAVEMHQKNHLKTALLAGLVVGLLWALSVFLSKWIG